MAEDLIKNKNKETKIKLKGHLKEIRDFIVNLQFKGIVYSYKLV